MADEWVRLAGEALGRIEGQHAEKKRATILALVDARLSGEPEESVWRRPGVCNRGTYHLKWKKDATFAEALAAVTTLARDWKDGRALRALQEAAEKLALAAPVAVGRAINLLGSDDENIRLRAAFGILDRAGVETAQKSSSTAEVKHDVEFDVSQLADDELDTLARIAGRFANAPGGAGPAAAD